MIPLWNVEELEAVLPDDCRVERESARIDVRRGRVTTRIMDRLTAATACWRRATRKRKSVTTATRFWPVFTSPCWDVGGAYAIGVRNCRPTLCVCSSIGSNARRPTCPTGARRTGFTGIWPTYWSELF